MILNSFSLRHLSDSLQCFISFNAMALGATFHYESRGILSDFDRLNQHYIALFAEAVWVFT